LSSLFPRIGFEIGVFKHKSKFSSAQDHKDRSKIRKIFLNLPDSNKVDSFVKRAKEW
jgi:hypothetical protein